MASSRPGSVSSGGSNSAGLRRNRCTTRRLADGDHAPDRATGARCDLGLDDDLVLPIAQRIAELLERDHLHEAAGGTLAHRLEPFAGSLLLEPVDDPRLGRDEETLLRRALR